jgi:uncharacterized protein (TIGR02118 family)
MHRVLVLDPHPADPDHLRACCEATHIPPARTLPGPRRSLDVSPLGPDAAPCVGVAALDFDDEAAVMASFRSPEGRAVAADVADDASGGITPMHDEVGQ